jgi:chitin synthase
MYLMIFLKSKDIITTTVWIISLIIEGMRQLINKIRKIETLVVENKSIISVIPVYSETYEQVVRTLDSIADNELGHNKHLMCIICDGKPNQLENTLTQTVLQKTINYKTWKMVDNSIQIIYGFYRTTPCMIIKKKKNQGKKDSLILSHDIFNYPRDTIQTPEVRTQVRTDVEQLYQLTEFDYMFCTDADSIIVKHSLIHLIETIQRRRAHACCGLVVIDFSEAKWSFWNLYQNFQYVFGQYIRRECENLMGSVTCMPGCITMFKIDPIAGPAIKMYSTLPPAGALIATSVQMLGTDRRLASSFLYQSSKVKHVLDCRAKCYTIPPNTLYQYVSQRRRWGSNMYFNSLCNIFAPHMNIVVRFFCFLDITRVSLAYFRIYNTVLFIYVLVTGSIHGKQNIYDILPFLIVIVFPIISFFIYGLFDSFLRPMYHKLIMGYLVNKILSFAVMMMIISNMFWNIGSVVWGGVQHKSSNVEVSVTISNESPEPTTTDTTPEETTTITTEVQTTTTITTTAPEETTTTTTAPEETTTTTTVPEETTTTTTAPEETTTTTEAQPTTESTIIEASDVIIINITEPSSIVIEQNDSLDNNLEAVIINIPDDTPDNQDTQDDNEDYDKFYEG